VLELELVRVVARRLPADPRDLGDGQLLGRGDVEVLVEPGGVRHGGHDAVAAALERAIA